MDAFPCSRHPDTETRLRCSACETAICPDCWVEAPVGYQCPGCAGSRGAASEAAAQAAGQRTRRLPGMASSGTDGAASSSRSAEGPSATIIARAVAVGVFAAAVGGLLLGPILQQGTLFLLSSGAIGWGVARAVFWGAEEVSTPLIRALAMAFAGATAAVGLVAAGRPEIGMLLLAWPAAMYGGWIVVRRR
ncbi:MAG: hypothetical protein WD010_00800 [Nitriliruptor sp.]|uniref:hypothetical protein n=1 Tax=Nitriliruptor sp. TaxID=2448056 RepID=UPI0034A06479